MKLFLKNFVPLVLYSNVFLYESMVRFTVLLSVNDGLRAPSFEGILPGIFSTMFA